MVPSRTRSNEYFFRFSLSGLNMNYVSTVASNYFLLLHGNELTVELLRIVQKRQ